MPPIHAQATFPLHCTSATARTRQPPSARPAAHGAVRPGSRRAVPKKWLSGYGTPNGEGTSHSIRRAGCRLQTVASASGTPLARTVSREKSSVGRSWIAASDAPSARLASSFGSRRAPASTIERTAAKPATCNSPLKISAANAAAANAIQRPNGRAAASTSSATASGNSATDEHA